MARHKSIYYDLMYIHKDGKIIKATKEYSTYCGLISRCKANKPSYENITVDEVFLDKVHGFKAFLDCIGPAPSPEFDIDRIDNLKGYVPGNIKWVTRTENLSNRSCTLKVKVGDDNIPLVKYCDQRSLNYLVYKQRPCWKKSRLVDERDL